MEAVSFSRRVVSSLENVFSDIRYSLRGWRRSPGFAISAILVMALGIGANTTIFSLIDAIFWRALPVRNPARLVTLSVRRPTGAAASFSYPAYLQFRSQSSSFESLSAFAFPVPSKVQYDGQPVDAQVQFATPEFFTTLGVDPERGSVAMSPDVKSNDAGTEPVAVVSYAYWVNHLESDPAVVGKAITVDGVSLTVMGVAARNFSGVAIDYNVDIWIPLGMQKVIQAGDNRMASDTMRWLFLVGRLKPQISSSEALAEGNLIYRRYLQSIHASTEDLRDHVVLQTGGTPVLANKDSTLSPLLMVLMLVIVILVIACVNVAGLLLARAAERQNEIAVRMALGVRRSGLIRQWLTESILLALAGGAAGLWLAYWGSKALLAITFARVGGGGTLPLLAFSPDTKVIVFTLGLSMLSGIIFGLAPALRSSRTYLGVSLKARNSSAARPSALRFEKICVAAELALSMMLLIMTGLLVRSFQNMLKIDMGFEPKGLVEAYIKMPRQYTGQQMNVLADRVAEVLRTRTGAESASVALPGPFSRLTYNCNGSLIDGAQTNKDAIFVTVVTPEYFQTMKIPMVQGRAFNSSDIASGPHVLIANQAAVRQYFHGNSPLGHHVSLLCGESSEFEVVGVARDVKFNNPLQEPPAMFYYLLSQSDQMVNQPIRILEVRGAGQILDPYRIRMLIEATSGAVVVQHSELMTTLIDRSIALPQFVAWLAGFFGVLGLLLAGVGLYGLISHSVRQRTAEIGVRMAMGAQRFDILWMVFRDAIKLVGIGIGSGLVLSVAATQILGSQLFGVARFDFVTMMTATVMQILVAGIAAQLPAWRASRVDPIVSLRYE